MQNVCINLDTDFSKIKETLLELSNKNELEICISYISNFESTKILREIMTELCKNYCSDDKFKSRVVLIVDELNNNAIEYWSNNGDINKVYIKINKEKLHTDICIEVEDTWKWTNHKDAKSMEELQKQRKEDWFDNYNSIRGRWLFLIIDKIVDKLYFRDSEAWGLIVGVEKKLYKK